MNTEPVIKKPRGSYFPKLPASFYANIYEVYNLDGVLLYSGSSEYVARLVLACMTPRSF
jgi:hypothetical protein